MFSGVSISNVEICRVGVTVVAHRILTLIVSLFQRESQDLSKFCFVVIKTHFCKKYSLISVNVVNDYHSITVFNGISITCIFPLLANINVL